MLMKMICQGEVWSSAGASVQTRPAWPSPGQYKHHQHHHLHPSHPPLPPKTPKDPNLLCMTNRAFPGQSCNCLIH